MKETINRISRDLNLPPDVIKRAYKAFWMFIRQTAEQMPLKENINEETFKKLRLNFNIPNLGKLACTYDRYLGLNKKNKLIKDKYAEHKENKTDG